jgi:hypothetical protein
VSPDEMLAELFGKFGLHDGDLPGGDDIQQLLSRHLDRRGFPNRRISSHHNRRICDIRVGDRWLWTRRWTETPPVWSLVDEETTEEVAVPESLGEAIREFLPRAARLFLLGCQIEADAFDDYDASAGEPNWMSSADPLPLLRQAQRGGSISPRKRRLFACACCRRIDLLLGEAAKHAVAVAERFADGQASAEEVRSLRDLVGHDDSAAVAACEACSDWGPDAGCDGQDAAESARLARTFQHTFVTADFVTEGVAVLAAEQAAQVALLRDIVGDPLRVMPVDASWLSWNGGTVLALAASIYEEGDFGYMPVLADALEEAGCTEAAILDHCRQREGHVRGCWLLDLILGLA